MLVDSHCHLDFPYLLEQIDDVLARAEQAGIGTMVTISTRVREFDKILGIAEAHENVYCSIGTHPHNAADERDVKLEELVAYADHPKVVAIGEAGLDYHYDNSPREDQAASFRLNIAAARETGLPLVIHTREADDDTAEILEDEAKKGQFSAGLALFLPRDGNWPSGGLRSVPTSHFRASSPSNRPKSCGRSPAMCPTTGSWSKPTRHFWRLNQCAANATNPPSWRTPPRGSRSCAV